jgi:hypothetical protein
VLERWNHDLTEPLIETLRFVRAEIPYYRACLAEPSAGDLRALLDSIPILTKRLAMAQKDRLRRGSTQRLGRFSTGTTSGKTRFLDVVTSEAEWRAIQTFERTGSFVEARDPSRWSEPVPPTLRVLEVVSPHYELPDNAKPMGATRFIWHHHPNAIRSLSHLLTSYDMLRIEPGHLVKATLLLEQSGFDFASSCVAGAAVHGYLSPRWRRFLEQKWSMKIVEVFSLSEVKSSALECTRGGHFHFSDLPLITEVIDPISGARIDRGQGHLVLTPLHPFVQEQPMLRYATGDLVRVVPCEASQRLGFRWEGRLMHAVSHPEGYLGERPFMDLLDAIPEVEKTPDDFETLGLLPPGTVGWPAFRLDLERTLHVTLRMMPAPYEGLAQRLEERIRAAIPEVGSILFYGPGQDAEARWVWDTFARPIDPALA